MNADKPAFIDRRQFLKSAVVLAGVAALDFRLQTRGAAAANTAPSATTLSYWSAGRFLDPSKIGSGDWSLAQTGVHVRIHDHFMPDDGRASLLSGCIPVFAVPAAGAIPPAPSSGALNLLPFYAWTASTAAPHSSYFYMPVATAKGLAFDVEMSATPATLESYYLSLGSGLQTAKLRAGTYAVATGSPNWRANSLVTKNGESLIAAAGGRPADFEYLLITITKG